MVDYRTFPDAEALVLYHIRTSSTIVGDRAYSEIPKSPTYPLVVVRRIGGIPTIRQALDNASLQIDVWAATKAEAQEVAQEMRVTIHEAEGTTINTGTISGFVSAVDDSLGLTWSVDEDTQHPRYTFGVSVSLH